MLQIAGLTAQGANVENIQTAALRLQRQLVREIGGTVLQMRMAAAEGMELADKIFSPVAGYDELQEDQAKASKNIRRSRRRRTRPKLSRRPEVEEGVGGTAATVAEAIITISRTRSLSSTVSRRRR